MKTKQLTPEKLRKKQNLGLTAKQKFLLQLVVAIAFIYLLRVCGIIEASAVKPHCIDLYVPFFNSYGVRDGRRAFYGVCHRHSRAGIWTADDR